MVVLPLKPRLTAYLESRHLTKRFFKRVEFLREDPWHPSLRTELLEPKSFGIYSFRITHKYRALFVYCGAGEIEIIDINDHYQ